MRTVQLRKPVIKTSTNFKIESGLDIPPLVRAKKYDLPLSQMKVGQSIFVPLADVKQEAALRATLSRYITDEREDSEGEHNFVLRKVETDNGPGFRIWRTEA